MALSISTMKTEIKNQLDAEYGTPEDADEQDKFVTAMATAILNILTTQATVTSNGVTLAGSPGGPLPITGLPGAIS